MNNLKLNKQAMVKILAACIVTLANLCAVAGGKDGGGGDANEIGVNLIRADILKWIQKGGAKAIKNWPNDLDYKQYVKAMIPILLPHRVIVGFVTTDQERRTNDPEQKVIVDGQFKSCRGFISVRDRSARILCNIERFPTNAADQYRLIHHEYAGLAGVEKNFGASSSYSISYQITKFLVPEISYRLAVLSEAPTPVDQTPQIKQCNFQTYFCPGTLNYALPVMEIQAGYGLAIMDLTTKFPDGWSTEYARPLYAKTSVLKRYCADDGGSGIRTQLTCTTIGNELVKIVDSSGNTIGE